MKRQARTTQQTIVAEASRALIAFATSLLLVSSVGCRQDMHNQPKFYPQRGSSFYTDGRSVRPQTSETVARSQGAPEDYFHTGLLDGKEGDGLPIPLTAETMARGQERFNIYCTPCHSRVGNGMGSIVQRGYYPAASFHSTRLRDVPLGHFFQVITKGYGAMPNYAAEVTPEDRWAIAIYIRALQLSQSAKQEDAAGQKAEPVQDIAAKAGLPREFLDAWFPPAHAHPAAPTADPVAAKPLAETAAKAPASAPSSTAKPQPAAPTQLAASTSPPTPAAPSPKPAAATHDTAAGLSMYTHNCAVCHQASRAGIPPTIPSLIGIVPKVGEARIRTVVAEGIPTGKPPMPSFNRLSDDDVDNLIAYLQANQ